MDKATPIRALSGPGKEIFEKMLKPLFLDVSQYDRVASYYNPRSLALILRELASLWNRGGTVRLILGFHERMEILPALRTDLEIRKSIKRAVAESMKGEVSALAKILGLDKESVIGVVRELLNQRALHVKLVTPRTNLDYYKSKGEWPRMEPATFHSKFMILHYGDANHSDERSFFSRLFRRWKDQHFYRPAGQRILAGRRFSVVTTSMNESVKAYTHNIEDAVLHRSWVQNEQQVSEYFLNRFEKLWMDNCDDAVSMPFTDEFEEILLEAVADEQPQYLSWSDFTAAIKESMIYHAISFPKVGLLPHQIGVYKQALSRWPVRVLLSDEVGLGKTIEGASIISFLMKNGYVNRCLVLTPASLRKQWQSELRSLFGLDFWVFNPSSGFLEGATNDHFVANDPLGNAGEIKKIIVSWHWARIGADSDALRIIKETMPDLLVVDEAHHARIRDTGSGEYHTQLYTLLKRAQEHIPHILLLTATPFQTDVLDYFSLLDILGVPEDFRDGLNEFGKWARGDIHDRRANKLRQLKAMHRYIRLYNLKTEFSFLRDLHETELQGTTYYASILDRIGSLPRESVIATHPTTLLSIRNLRSTLEEIGYTFPEAHMDAPDIKISDEQLRFLQQIDDYVSNFLGLPEQELNTGGHIGLMRSLYRQRMVSSIKAAFDTLSRRREKLDSFIKGAAFS
ncbi:MAG: SNF2-related protein [Candidatus Thorarchaeota archaeon]